MAWQDTMVTMLRVVIDDMGSNPTYSDSRLEEVIVVAANLTKQDVDFDSDYTIGVTDLSISPDPTTSPDNAFINLVTLKSACLLANSEYKTCTNYAISVRDGSAAIDKRGVAAAKKEWRDSICKDYNIIVSNTTGVGEKRNFVRSHYRNETDLEEIVCIDDDIDEQYASKMKYLYKFESQQHRYYFRSDVLRAFHSDFQSTKKGKHFIEQFKIVDIYA